MAKIVDARLRSNAPSLGAVGLTNYTLTTGCAEWACSRANVGGSSNDLRADVDSNPGYHRERSMCHYSGMTRGSCLSGS